LPVPLMIRVVDLGLLMIVSLGVRPRDKMSRARVHRQAHVLSVSLHSCNGRP